MENNSSRRFNFHSFFPDTKELHPLLTPLRTFEVSLIARFIPTPHKLKVIATLSKSWLHFVYQNYAWSEFPSKTQIAFLSGYLNFLEQF